MIFRWAAVFLPALLLSVLALTHPALADLEVRFEEDAPKDRFIITNASACELTATFKLNLRASRSGLIFDTASGGAGENVAQPLEVADGRAFLASMPSVSDGAQDVRIDLKAFKAGATVILTIDVDDSVPSGPMGVQMISGSEIAGAQAIIEFKVNEEFQASFDSAGKLRLTVPACS